MSTSSFASGAAAAKADGIGPEGGAGGEDPQPGVSPQPGGPDRGGPVRPDRLGELPDQPDMGKALQPPQGVGVSELRLKDQLGPQGLHQPALPGNAEFFPELGFDPRHDLHFMQLRHRSASFARRSAVDGLCNIL